MKKICVQNLAMILTNKCNLNCNHCLRGCKNDHCMSDDVINATLNQIKGISNLSICGGEPTLALDVLENLFNQIIKNNIYLEEVSCVINGTNYSEKFLELLESISEYVTFIKKKNEVFFNISYDQYHIEEIKRLKLEKQFLENVKKYYQSKFFNELQKLYNPILFREGNAENLENDKTVPLRPMKNYITYVGSFHRLDKLNGLCNIGPLVTINPDGIITECNASIAHQNSVYNYGNILNDSIEEIMTHNYEIVSPHEWLKLTNKEVNKYLTYQR